MSDLTPVEAQQPVSYVVKDEHVVEILAEDIAASGSQDAKTVHLVHNGDEAVRDAVAHHEHTHEQPIKNAEAAVEAKAHNEDEAVCDAVAHHELTHEQPIQNAEAAVEANAHNEDEAVCDAVAHHEHADEQIVPLKVLVEREDVSAKEEPAPIDVEDDAEGEVSVEEKSVSADDEHGVSHTIAGLTVAETNDAAPVDTGSAEEGAHEAHHHHEGEHGAPLRVTEEIPVEHEPLTHQSPSEEAHDETTQVIAQVIHESLRTEETVAPVAVMAPAERLHAHDAVQPVAAPMEAVHVTQAAVPASALAPTAAVSSARVHHPKPALNGNVVAWKGLTYSSYDDSEDEFELSTCRCPVYEQNENEDGSCTFRSGAPAMAGDVTSCFEEAHLLYRIVDSQNKTWAFYNDSRTYEMHIQFTFGKHSNLQALDHTTMTRNEDGSWCATVVVYPTETERFVKGRVNGFTSKLRALPLSDEYHDTCRRQNDEEIQQQVAAIRRVCDSERSEEVLQACIAHQLPFVDPEFPPCQASLDRGAAKPFRPLAWARPRSYLPNELADQVRLFRGDINPGRVEPGELGDSWLLCAMASVTENQDWLRNLFRHPLGKVLALKEHALGAYRVSFNKHGVWHCVVVDDYLPVSAGVPKYARSADDPAEIWPCILQKALAKLYGSYARIGTGDPLHALTDMTGFAHFRFDEAMMATRSGDAEGKSTAIPDLGGRSLWSTMMQALTTGYTVMMSTPTMYQALHGTPSSRRRSKDGSQTALTEGQIQDLYKSVGLVMGHAYTILDAKEFAERRLCLLRVRNIWGRGVSWSGPWHRGDERWQQHPDVAEACEMIGQESGDVADDGTFWMPWELAMEHFTGGGICYGQPFVYDYRVPGMFDQTIPSVLFEINVTAPAWMTLILSQNDYRFMARARNEAPAGHPQLSVEQEHAPLMLSICTPSEDNMMRVAMNSTVNCELPSEDRWTFLQAREVSIVRRFEPGRYLVVPRTMTLEGQASELPFTLGLITDQEIGENGAATVHCVRLPASSNVFENFAQFDEELVPCDAIEYQKRLLNGCVQNIVSSNDLQ